MRLSSVLVLAGAALVAGTLNAQTAAPAPPPTVVKAVQPGLLEVSGPRVNEVVAAGIQKITAAPGKGLKAISVHSPWGTSYFGWPKDVKAVGFTIDAAKPGATATISAPGFTEANRADYKAAIDAVVPKAIAMTNENKALKLHGQATPAKK